MLLDKKKIFLLVCQKRTTNVVHWYDVEFSLLFKNNGPFHALRVYTTH